MSWLRGFTKYQLCLLGTFAVLWILFALKPTTRQNWMFENALVAIFVPLALGTARYFRLSDFSYTLITVYLILHLVGAYYNYSEVPFGATLGRWVGDPDRNHYDRLVHFSFGFLLAYPIREVFHRIASVRGFWGYFLPFDVTMCFSALYEIIEWLVTINVSPGAGAAYLGSQGDEWDTQKDMAIAGVGALLAMIIIALVNWWYDPNFWHEMRESFRVKSQQPLGEVRLRELIAERRKRKEAARAGKKEPAGEQGSGGEGRPTGAEPSRGR
jgi:putative membrane protein